VKLNALCAQNRSIAISNPHPNILDVPATYYYLRCTNRTNNKCVW